MEKKQTLYEILGVSQSANLIEIKTAYRRRAMEHHPDVNPGANNESCHKLMCKINEAYRVLRDPNLREAYDQTLYENGEYGVPSEDGIVSTPPDKTPRNESQTGTYKRMYKPNSGQYSYYNKMDYDENMQEKFIEWIEDFYNEYIRLALDYYKKLNVDGKSILEEIYDGYKDIIDYEKSLLNKRQKSYRL